MTGKFIEQTSHITCSEKNEGSSSAAPLLPKSSDNNKNTCDSSSGQEHQEIHLVLAAQTSYLPTYVL